VTEERALLAGGCFWGVQDLFRRYDGVLSTRVGYTGGNTPNATYRNHGAHAEAVEIIFDPARISYRQILEFYFQIHDPTTRNRQGNDMGPSYRSAIFYHSPEQKATAEEVIKEITAEGIYDDPIVTEVTAFDKFWPAENYHQEYFANNPNQPYCAAVVAPKVAKFRKKFADRLKSH
jgi:peptide-methionine (S)-S-oxide reductase